MLNSERFNTSPISNSNGVNLLDNDKKAIHVNPRLELMSPDRAIQFRFKRGRRRHSRISLAGQLFEYMDSSMATSVVRHPYSTPSPIETSIKRGLDITISLLLIAVFAPIFLIVAACVKLTSSGPILFRQSRLRENGEVFTCLKFRTMVEDAEELLRQKSELSDLYYTDFKIKDDPRITKIGKFLRKSSLDELPQLFNVLTGTMSLVGPRPIVPQEIEKYGCYAEKLLTVRPGLTGIWQVCGRSDTTYEERVMMDMFYVDRGNPLMDLQLVFVTVFSVLRGRGAY